MTLAEYLKKVKMSYAVLARIVGSSPGYISRIVVGDVVPGDGLALTISAVTRGNVKYDDLVANRKDNIRNKKAFRFSDRGEK